MNVKISGNTTFQIYKQCECDVLIQWDVLYNFLDKLYLIIIIKKHTKILPQLVRWVN